MDPAITAHVKVILDTKDQPITDTNINPTQYTLVHQFSGLYQIFQIHGNAVDSDLPNDIKINDTVNISRLKVDYTDDFSVARWPPPQGSSYFINTIRNHRPSSGGTGREYKVKCEGWDEKDST